MFKLQTPMSSGPTPDAIEPPEGPASRPVVSFRADVVSWAFILSVTIAALFFFYSHGLTDLYGDAIAHTEGARRIFDSLTPGYDEIGSAWLPLFHLLASPLARSDFLWRTGLAGSLVSAAAFALTAWLLFRVGAEMNRTVAAGVVAVAAFVLCPNMLYLASTPLTEPLALLWSVLVVFGLFRFHQTGRTRALIGAAVAAFFGALTRYDGWFLLPFAALFVLLAPRPARLAAANSPDKGSVPTPLHHRAGLFGSVTKAEASAHLREAFLFSIIAGAAPLLWLAHNAYKFGNPLEFYNGPYSAQAIYAHQLATTGFRYPTDGSFRLSAQYFLEDCKLVMGAWPLELMVLGFVAWAADGTRRSRRSPALLFLVPLPFYLNSMAHAAVPIYVPTLFPHTYYNLRYGLEMLPAVALFPSFLLSTRLPRRTGSAVLTCVLGVYLTQAVETASAGPGDLVVAKESILNTPCRSQRQQAVISFLRRNYNGQTIILAAGKWPCVMPELGIPYRKTITETNRKQWRAIPSGPDPAVRWIIRGEGDRVDELMRAHPQAFRDFQLAQRSTFTGEGSVEIYRRGVLTKPLHH